MAILFRFFTIICEIQDYCCRMYVFVNPCLHAFGSLIFHSKKKKKLYQISYFSDMNKNTISIKIVLSQRNHFYMGLE